MSLSFYVNDDGQLAPHPSAFSGRPIELQSPARVWRAPRGWRLTVQFAVPVLVICGLVALLTVFR